MELQDATHVVYSIDTACDYCGSSNIRRGLAVISVIPPRAGTYVRCVNMQNETLELLEEEILYVQRWVDDGYRNVVPACAHCTRPNCANGSTGYLATGYTLAECSGFDNGSSYDALALNHVDYVPPTTNDEPEIPV